MKDSDVTYFSGLLNLDAETVKGAIEDGTLGVRVKDAVMSKKDVDIMKDNYAKEVKASYLNELAENAKQGELPQAIYKPIHGAVFEKLEKTLSKKFDVSDFDNVEDLVTKAISKNKGQTDDKALEEQIALNEELKKANKRILTEKEETEARIKADFESKILQRDMKDHVNKVPFDLSDVKEDELEKAYQMRQRTLTSVFDTTYDTELIDGNIVVKDKEGNVLKNQATLEPIPVSNVLSSLAKEVGIKLKSPETGGQGGKSSGSKSTAFKSVAEYNEYCEQNNILPTSREGLTLFAESGLNPLSA